MYSQTKLCGVSLAFALMALLMATWQGTAQPLAKKKAPAPLPQQQVAPAMQKQNNLQPPAMAPRQLPANLKGANAKLPVAPNQANRIQPMANVRNAVVGPFPLDLQNVQNGAQNQNQDGQNGAAGQNGQNGEQGQNGQNGQNGEQGGQ